MALGYAGLSFMAINQYRPRDAFTYIALRLFLENTNSRSDYFITQVANKVVRSTGSSSYLRLPFFKEVEADGKIVHRTMHMPSAVDALGEMAVIRAAQGCSNIPDQNICFSYWPATDSSRGGAFAPYMIGLQRRQSAIALALRGRDDWVVRYLDIEKFYPSLRTNDIKRIWLRH